MTNPTKDANDLLMGSGAPTAKFPHIGAIVSGAVVREPEARQQKDFRTGELEVWKDGSPKMMVVVQLATNERDTERPDDDGTRTLYIQGKELTKAVRDAVRASGANGLHTGGVLTVQNTGEGIPENANLNPPKLYAAHYQPPAVSFNGVTGPATQAAPVQQQIQYTPQAAPAQQQFVPQAQPAQQVQYAPQVAPQPVAQPAPVQQFVPQVVPQAAPVQQHIPANVIQSVTPNVAQDAPPPGVDPNLWARMNDTQRAALLAAVAQPAY